MAQKDSEKEYEALKSEDVTEQLENFTNSNSSQRKKIHVRTFAKDVAEQMRTDSASVVKIALAEQGRHREYEKIVKNTKKQQVIFLILTFIFVVGGAIIFAFALRSENSTVDLDQPIQQERANSIVFSENQIIVDVTNLSRSEIITNFTQNAESTREKGITNLIAVIKEGSLTRTLNGGEFLSTVALNVPSNLISLLRKDFMIGVDGNNDYALFIIISFDNFDNVINLMREWEPFFVQDMSRLLIVETGGDLELFSRSFQSEILFNKESRVLRDRNQGYVVGYTFMDRNTLVLSTKLETIRDVLSRYSIQSIK